MPAAWLTLDQAFKTVVGRRFELGGDRGRLLVRKDAVCLYPHLVWRPCRESLSPYYPFFMFTLGNERLYVRVDGAVFRPSRSMRRESESLDDTRASPR